MFIFLQFVDDVSAESRSCKKCKRCEKNVDLPLQQHKKKNLTNRKVLGRSMSLIHVKPAGGLTLVYLRFSLDVSTHRTPKCFGMRKLDLLRT